jgi:hypothetical protein
MTRHKWNIILLINNLAFFNNPLICYVFQYKKYLYISKTKILVQNDLDILFLALIKPGSPCERRGSPPTRPRLRLALQPRACRDFIAYRVHREHHRRAPSSSR